jgi:hypothetical protein
MPKKPLKTKEMKKRILLLTAVLGMSYLLFSSHSAGPAAAGYDCTGAETANIPLANPTGCSTGHGCHSTAATTGIDVAITLYAGGIPTTHYIGGQTYIVTITGTPGSATTNTWYGFQLNALKGTASASSNADAGTWSGTGLPTGTHKVAPGSFTQLTVMEHDMPLNMTGTSFSESFTWTAPAAGTGSISFWGAVNFVNHNTFADNSDVWNTNMAIITESTAFVANVPNNISLTAFPNPVSNNLSLQMNNTQAGTYSLHVFDMNGRSVTTDNIEVSGTSHTSNINTTNWLPGTYQVVIEKDGSRQTIPVIKL